LPAFLRFIEKKQISRTVSIFFIQKIIFNIPTQKIPSRRMKSKIEKKQQQTKKKNNKNKPQKI